MLSSFPDKEKADYKNVIKNLEDLNKKYPNEGWEVKRVDELKNTRHPTLIYILKKEK